MAKPVIFYELQTFLLEAKIANHPHCFLFPQLQKTIILNNNLPRIE